MKKTFYFTSLINKDDDTKEAIEMAIKAVNINKALKKDVITSYSIHYTKLYDLLKEPRPCFAGEKPPSHFVV